MVTKYDESLYDDFINLSFNLYDFTIVFSKKWKP